MKDEIISKLKDSGRKTAVVATGGLLMGASFGAVALADGDDIQKKSMDVMQPIFDAVPALSPLAQEESDVKLGYQGSQSTTDQASLDPESQKVDELAKDSESNQTKYELMAC